MTRETKEKVLKGLLRVNASVVESGNMIEDVERLLGEISAAG